MARWVSVIKRLTGTQREFFQTRRAIPLSISSQSLAVITVHSVLMKRVFHTHGEKALSGTKAKL